MSTQEYYTPLSGRDISLHYIIKGSPELKPLLLLHGLTANAHAFDGLLSAGLADHYHTISLDLRGRGLSSQPAFNYTVRDHALDVINLMDSIGLAQVAICGHSYGGLLGCYLAAHYPKRVERLFLLDAAAQMHPRAMEMLGSAIGRLEKKFPSFDAYLEEIKKAPYLEEWHPEMETYYAADVKPTGDGGITPIPNLHNIIEVAKGTAAENWPSVMKAIRCPVVLINALDAYNLGMPLLPEEKARETVEMIRGAVYVPVRGNHQTMLYGRGAKQIVTAILAHGGEI
jgi:pimeloyl-ACP methyl ester carboxylesterase